ncbi:restriction endonuclease subunit S [Vibrio vulnificus]|nr:restriction endonuclease subunit S [Vibrio vulnificus]
MSFDYDPKEFVTVPVGWECKRLVDCTEDGNISYGIVQPGQHIETGIPVLRVNNVNNGNLDLADVLKVSPDIEKKYKRTRLEGGEVLLTLVGSTGQSFVAPKYLSGWNVPRAIAVIRADKTIGANWINICLQSSETKHFLDVRANTTVQKTLNLKDVRDIPILIPPSNVKKTIEDISESLRIKIELNTQTNQTLEQIAQAIFKSWFVDFDPVKAKIETLAEGGSADDAELAAMSVISAKTLDELNSLKASNPEAFNKLAQTAALFPKDLDSETGTPAGWNSGVIADIAKLNANSWTKKNRPEQVHYVDLSNTKNGRIETVTTYGFDEAPSRARRILNSGDTIIGTVRPGNRAFAFIGETEKPLTGSTGFAVLSPKEEFWTSFVYLATTNDDAIDEYARLADGGAYPAIKPEVVADTPCVLPTKDIAQKFWQLTGAMLKKAHQARLENEELAKTRDTLLPKLLSGEINVTSEVVE